MSDGIYLGCDYKTSFRVCGLSERVLEKITASQMKGVTYRVGANHKNRSEKILVVPLNETITAGFLQSIIKAAENHTHYEFIVSTVNDNESFIIELPEYICKLIQEVGGGINFSYTCAGE